ncbi:protein kinase [Dactylosporangium vinaceum]|uniref:Serine/threonine-protein kinase n=1 Tax=Dactylosporangium vinaceum TaxID=53362 RepID=A0ABV5MCI9_9ACTN|nr:serine/threonine-protein kinase [Dactylosporangium vinaceum]UAB92196.1 protein kinase [Dactylosporangium vinaceum]
MGDSPAPLRDGDPATVGSYRLLGVLGVGGMGTVYLATGAGSRQVALKVINPAFYGDPMFRHRFAAEAAAASRVAGFCTARVLDVALDGAVPHIVTEYVQGPSLHDYATAHGPLAGQVEAVAVGVAAALTAIHAVGLVHADLSPRNVLLSPFGPKVIDFGVARLLGHTAAHGPTFGTPGWLAPEQVRGWPPSQASDVYAWGLLVAWAGTGQLPPGDLAGLDPATAAMVRRCLDPDPQRRPTARQVLLALVGQDDPAAAQVAATVRGSAPAARPRSRRGATAAFAKGAAPVSPPTRPVTAVSTGYPGLAAHGGYPGLEGHDGPAPRTGRGFRPPLPVAPPPPRRRPRRAGRGIATGLALIALLAVLLVALSLAQKAGRGELGSPAPTPASPTPSPTPKRSPVAQDGKLRFTLAGFSCGRKELGDWPLTRKPDGQYCLAQLKVENTGDSKARIWVGYQKLRDSAGKEYGPDELAWVWYADARPLFNEIAPDTAVTGTLVFDVPEGLQFTELRVKSGLVGGDSSAIRLP